MKGLRKYISPFAPDQSGATAVFCELGGLVIILDAGGCAGNVCGFDEPRWFASKSAIFSAGLRDMDAILGRDDKLVEKIKKACEKIDGKFVAVIGTPVPAVIGTDYTALRRMIEKQTGLLSLTVDTNGMDLYDEGVKKASLEMFQRFLSKSKKKTISNSLGVLGATPMDLVGMEEGTAIQKYYQEKGWEQVFCYGMGSGISEIQQADRVQKNVVISPAGLAAARYLKKEYDIPYQADYPLETLPDWTNLLKKIQEKKRKKVLIVHQQVLANTLREEIRKYGDADVQVASWFLLEKEWKESEDIHLKEEDQWISLVKEGNYDLIIGEELFQRAIPEYQGDYIALPHFAVSGKKRP